MWVHIIFLVFRAFKSLSLSALKSMCMPVHITILCLTNQIAAGNPAALSLSPLLPHLDAPPPPLAHLAHTSLIED